MIVAIIYISILIIVVFLLMAWIINILEEVKNLNNSIDELIEINHKILKSKKNGE